MIELLAKYGTYIFIGAVIFFFFAMFIVKGKKAEDIGTTVAGLAGLGVVLLIVGGSFYYLVKSIFF
jgi:hypothetical protein